MHTIDRYYFDGAWRVRCSCGFRYSSIDHIAAGLAGQAHARAEGGRPAEAALAVQEAERLLRGET